MMRMKLPSKSALVIRLAVVLVAGVACTAGPVAHCSAQSAPTLDPAAMKRLEAYRGVHPRLLLDAVRVAELREAIKTTHAALWKGAKDQADFLTRHKPPAYREKTRYGPWDDGSSESWQQQVGIAMPRAAMAYLLTGEKEYLSAAREWALASCSYPTWGLGNLDGMDLAAAAQMYGLALVYDWCYADLDAGGAADHSRDPGAAWACDVQEVRGRSVSVARPVPAKPLVVQYAWAGRGRSGDLRRRTRCEPVDRVGGRQNQAFGGCVGTRRRQS